MLHGATICVKPELASMDKGLPPTDVQLVAAARRGDGLAFRQLVDRHAPALYRLALGLVGNAADADDVVQETFAGAFAGLVGFRGQAAVKTWLTQILIRQASRHHRNRLRNKTIRLNQNNDDVPDSQAGSASAGGGSASHGSDLRIDLAQAISALGMEHREVIVLRELQGMSYDQIAAVLAVPKGTVESRLFRARKELQALLKEYLP
jgi:RNA polymerase sigma-70 factor (ECF subfamily)